MGLYTELFYAIIPVCFRCSAIPTSPYILKVFTLVITVTNFNTIVQPYRVRIRDRVCISSESEMGSVEE